jgi:hypothetical protein
MHRTLAAVRPDEPLDTAFLKMQQSGYPVLPVIDRLGRLDRPAPHAYRADPNLILTACGQRGRNGQRRSWR